MESTEFPISRPDDGRDQAPGLGPDVDEDVTQHSWSLEDHVNFLFDLEDAFDKVETTDLEAHDDDQGDEQATSS